MIPKYRGQTIPVIPIPPNWDRPVKWTQRYSTVISEALDSTEERQCRFPRALYGLDYETLTLSSAETAYLRRLLGGSTELPVACALWPMACMLKADAPTGTTVLSIDDLTGCLFDVFYQFALLWQAFDHWEVVELGPLTAVTATLAAGVSRDYSAGAFLLPLAYGTVEKDAITQVTDEHGRWQCRFQETFHRLHDQGLPEAAPAEEAFVLVIIGGTPSSITLGWGESPTLEGFVVEQKVGAVFQEVASLQAGTRRYTVTGLQPDTSYTFRVKSGTEYTNEASSLTGPAAPTDLVLSNVTDTTVNLTWVDHSTTEIGYQVERKTGNTTFTVITSLGPNAQSYQAVGLTPGTAYTFRVRAYNQISFSEYSNEASIATSGQPPVVPGAPVFLVAVPEGSLQIRLTWLSNDTSETGFHIEQKHGNEAFQEVAVVGPGVTTWVAKDLLPDTLYTFRVRASNGFGYSAYSNEASAIPYLMRWAGIRWRGPWVADTDYASYDAVEHEGSSYVATSPNVGSEPPSDKWDLMAARGLPGTGGGSFGDSFAVEEIFQVGGSITVNMDGKKFQWCQMTGDAAISAINLGSAKFVSLKLHAGASARALTFPPEWKWVGTNVSNGVTLEANKRAAISLTCYSSNINDLLAVYAWEDDPQ